MKQYGICTKESLNDINVIVDPFRTEVEHCKVTEMIKALFCKIFFGL
jgi:hypothetical protein